MGEKTSLMKGNSTLI